MEASTKKGQLRLQLLAGEQDINTLSGFHASGKLQVPDGYLPGRFPIANPNPNANMGQGPYGSFQPSQNLSNHDLITPVHQRGGYDAASRKGSMASSMSMGRLFKKKEVFFDDDAGFDIGDVSGNTVTFNDIQHLRDNNGRYSISARTTDLTPIIPVLSAGGKQNTQNNIQYRKYMNHKKKMELANGARTMSLANNPMGANLLASNDARAMSMGMMSDPRTMSLNSAPGRQMYPSQSNYGPRAMSMRPGVPGQRGPGQRGPLPPNLRTNSLNSNVMLGQGQGPMQGLSPQAIRSQSLTQGGGPFPSPQRFGPGNAKPMPYGPGAPPPGGLPVNNAAGPPYGNYQHPPRSNIPNGHVQNARYNGMPPNAALSNESFMNVVEEEEEEKEPAASTPHSLDPGKTFSPQNEFTGSRKLPNDDIADEDEEDIVYNFENDASSPQISRKSTIKKSNSMRVRKLDLFNKVENHKSPETVYEDGDSRSIELVGVIDKLSKKLTFDDSELHDFNKLNAEKFQTLGSSASEPDCYTTASEFSPAKNTDNSKNEVDNQSPYVPPGSTETANPASPGNQKRKVIKLKSLVANTAFNNLRSPSSNSQATFSLESNSKESSEFDHNDSKNNGSSSKISIYSHDYSKTDTKGYLQEGADIKDRDAASAVHNKKYDHDLPELPTELSQSETPSTPINNNEGDTTFELQSTHGSHAPSSDETRSEDILARNTSGNHLSRSGSDLDMERYVQSPGRERRVSSFTDAEAQRERRKSTISSKSRSFIKRLSRSGSKATEKDVGSNSQKHRSTSSIGSYNDGNAVKKPLHFTKEELAIMTCNNDLQNELQLVASELAALIKRELALEAQIRSQVKGLTNDASQTNYKELDYENREKSRQIAQLQEKLNNERRLRFISEEHAILSEHGQSPSALKLDYEKNELYKQLLAKNDLVNQLQDKLNELQTKQMERGDDSLLESYNELVRRNHELKAQLNQQSKGDSHLTGWFSSSDLTVQSASLVDRDSEKAEIMALREQRDELREMITKLTSSQNVELKIAHDKIKTLEFKLEKMSLINDKLSRRVGETVSTESQNSGPQFKSGQGGKLQGLSIVTPKHNLFDE